MSKYRTAAAIARLASQVKRLEAAVAKIPCDISTQPSEDDTNYAKFVEVFKSTRFNPLKNPKNTTHYSATDGDYLISQNKASGAVCVVDTRNNRAKNIAFYGNLKSFTDFGSEVLPDWQQQPNG